MIALFAGQLPCLRSKCRLDRCHTGPRKNVKRTTCSALGGGWTILQELLFAGVWTDVICCWDTINIDQFVNLRNSSGFQGGSAIKVRCPCKSSQAGNFSFWSETHETNSIRHCGFLGPTNPELQAPPPPAIEDLVARISLSLLTPCQ